MNNLNSKVYILVGTAVLIGISYYFYNELEKIKNNMRELHREVLSLRNIRNVLDAELADAKERVRNLEMELAETDEVDIEELDEEPEEEVEIQPTPEQLENLRQLEEAKETQFNNLDEEDEDYFESDVESSTDNTNEDILEENLMDEDKNEDNKEYISDNLAQESVESSEQNKNDLKREEIEKMTTEELQNTLEKLGLKSDYKKKTTLKNKLIKSLKLN